MLVQLVGSIYLIFLITLLSMILFQVFISQLLNAPILSNRLILYKVLKYTHACTHLRHVHILFCIKHFSILYTCVNFMEMISTSFILPTFITTTTTTTATTVPYLHNLILLQSLSVFVLAHFPFAFALSFHQNFFCFKVMASPVAAPTYSNQL